eukprot:jgi/Mesen1/808/ME000110S_11076
MEIQYGIVIALILIVTRVVYTILALTGRPVSRRRADEKVSTLIVLGSGGHTAEMLNLVAAMDLSSKYRPRTYIAAATDNMSLTRARTMEEKLARESEQVSPTGASYWQIYRSREVGQSYVTSVGTTLLAFAHATWLVLRSRPQLILCNGPGTCLPICLAGFLLKVLGVKSTTLVYVESVARVQKLSLTGSLLYKLHITDQFFVQWPKLTEKYPGTLYVGRLI